MKRLLLAIKLSVATALLGLITVVTPVSALAGPTNIVAATSKQNVCEGAGLSAAECDGTSSGLNGVVKAILNILTVIVGIAAVIMIIISGFRYITSGGDAAKVGAAKSSLIYAIVGLVVVALAQVIVHFVLGKLS